MSDWKSVRVERSEDGRRAEVVLVGPGKGNAFGPDAWRELPLVFAELDADPQVRAVLVRGDGRMFSAGLDLPAMGADMGRVGDDGGLAGARDGFLRMVKRMQTAMDAVAACRHPVVAAVHGWCIGAGLDLVAACDIRVCSADARFSLREVKVAIVADMGSLQRLPYIVGEGWTRRLALTGEDVDAATAERMGLVSEVLPDQETALKAARDLCDVLAANPPLVVQHTKRVLEVTRDMPLTQGLDYVGVWNAAFLPSHDLGEAMVAFAQKRPPAFEGR